MKAPIPRLVKKIRSELSDYYANFVSVMDRLLKIIYWIVSILMIAAIVTSLGYRLSEAVFIGTLFLPGAFAAEYFFPKATYGSKVSSIKNMAFVTLSIIVTEILLFLLAHFCLLSIREESMDFYAWPVQPEVLTNPIFISLITGSLAVGSHFFGQWLDRKYPKSPKPVTFMSERKPISLEIREILFIESNDSITTVYATENRHYRNKTPISQWEAILGYRFIRIHRSFLVNGQYISKADTDTIYINGLELPISRKYRDSVGTAVLRSLDKSE